MSLIPDWGQRLFVTKPGNPRFFIHADRLVDVRCGLVAVDDAHGAPFAVKHLREADDVARQRQLLGKFDYDPAADIDRYLVVCGSFDEHVERCAVFEVLEAAVERQLASGRGDPAGDDGAGQAGVRGGDGSVGPIAAMVEDEFEFIPGMPELVKGCQACEHSRNCGERKRGNGNDGGEDAAHAGIIAYLRRIWNKIRKGRIRQ